MDVSKRNLRKLMAFLMVFVLMMSTVGPAFAVTTGHSEDFASHTADSFDADSGNCKEEGCNYTLTQFRTDCPAADLHAKLVKGGTCGLCGYVGEVEHDPGHTTFSEYNSTNANDSVHWKVCSEVDCNVVSGIAKHTWSNGTCDVCQYECTNAKHPTADNPGTCPNCGLTIEASLPTHDGSYTHVKADFMKDGELQGTCQTGKECTATLADFQAACKHVDAPVAGGTCDTCGKTDVPEHKADFASHSKDAFNAGKCTLRSACTYALTKFQEDCDKNGGNHANILTTTTCPTCGAAGTKTESGAHVHKWTEAWSNDETHHWHECVGNGKDCNLANDQKNAWGAHVWTAKDGICVTCKMICKHVEWDAETGTCEICGMACAHAKTTATALADNAGYHKIVCDTCGKVVTASEECDTDGAGNACSKCGYKAPVELDNGLTVVGTAAVRADTVKNGTGAAVVTTEGDVVKVAVTLTSEPGKTIGGDPQDGQPAGTPNYHLTIPITGLTTADWKLVTGADNQGGQYGYDDAEHPEWNVDADNLMLWLPVTDNTCKVVLKNGTGDSAKYQIVEVTTVQVATPAHPAGYTHVFADFELVNGVPTCKADGCDVTITMVEYQRLHNPHTWAEDKSGVCDVCGIACPNTSEHGNIVDGETCETCGFVGTKHIHHWTDGVCDGAGTCPGCSLSDSHATILKGEVCEECGYIGTYVAPVTVPLEVEKSVDNGTVKAEPEGAAVTKTITDARTGDDVSPVAPVNLVIDMTDSTGDAGAATLTLVAATVTALVDAQTVEVEDSEGQTTSVSAPVTLVVMNAAGAVALPIEAVTMAQDSDATASVVVDLANVTSSDLKDQLTAIQEGGQDVYKDDQGAVVDVDNAVALDVTLSKGNTEATITGLDNEILITMKAPDGAKGVKVYYVDDTDKSLKSIGGIVLVDENGNATFGVDHLTTFVMVETHVHDWNNGVCGNPNCPGCPDAANHPNILTTKKCATCGLPGTKHTEERDAHNLDSFNEDGSCKTDGCHYTLTQFQESCPLAATHANLLTTQKCEECGFVGTDHNNTFAAHDKDGFNADGSCKHDDCDYTLAQFQSDCDKNGGNHADILKGHFCEICGAEGTKSSGGGNSGSGSSGNNGGTTQKPDTSTTTDPETGAVTVTTKNPDGSSVVTITQKDGTKTTINTDANGKVVTTVELKTTTIEAAAGDPVKLPMNTVAVTKSESSAETVTVKTENGNNVTVAIPASGATAGTVAMVMNSDGTYSVVKNSVVANGSVVVNVANGATVKLVDRGMTFADMTGHWATDAVAFATARDLFNGTSATTFSPNSPMTRAMVVTVLARYDGVNTDGGSTWYAKGVEWAMSKGVSDGTNPTADISREQLVTMLWRYVGEPGAGANLNGYTDSASVSSYATNAMRWAVENGVIKGRTSTTLAPKGQATRAEVAQIFQNLLSIAN